MVESPLDLWKHGEIMVETKNVPSHILDHHRWFFLADHPKLGDVQSHSIPSGYLT